MEEPIGYFRCLKCGFEWKNELLPFGTTCFRCTYKYVKWLNYDQLREKWDFEERNK